MKALFYGGAVAAVSGLLLGAAMKSPLAVEDFEPMAEITGGFETAELNGYAVAPYQYVAPAAYTPVTSLTPFYAVEDEPAELEPAVYTVEPDDPTPEAVPVYDLAAVEPDEQPANIIRSTDALPDPPVVEHSQGFALVEDASDPS